MGDSIGKVKEGGLSVEGEKKKLVVGHCTHKGKGRSVCAYKGSHCNIVGEGKDGGEIKVKGARERETSLGGVDWPGSISFGRPSTLRARTLHTHTHTLLPSKQKNAPSTSHLLWKTTTMTTATTTTLLLLIVAALSLSLSLPLPPVRIDQRPVNVDFESIWDDDRFKLGGGLCSSSPNTSFNGESYPSEASRKGAYQQQQKMVPHLPKTETNIPIKTMGVKRERRGESVEENETDG